MKRSAPPKRRAPIARVSKKKQTQIDEERRLQRDARDRQWEAETRADDLRMDAVRIEATTARSVGTARPRTLSILCEIFKAWHRARACALCGAPAQSFHHYPVTGRGPVNDLSGFGVCGDGVLGCHGRCQRYEVTKEVQAHAALAARGSFFVFADPGDIDKALQQIARGGQ